LPATINPAIIAKPRHRILILIVARLSSSLSRYKHQPPGAHLVPELLEQLCDYVNDHWKASGTSPRRVCHVAVELDSSFR